MTSDQQYAQIDMNYDAFESALDSILVEHRGEHALMRDRAIVCYSASAGDAYRAGLARFPDGIFSIQEVTDVPVDLGFWSHVGGLFDSDDRELRRPKSVVC